MKLRARLRATALIATVLVAGGVVVSPLASLVPLAPAEPARAAGASVSVSVVGRPDLTGVADPAYLTELQLSGSGFQSIVNGFGGVYVLFGWVDGDGWQPSRGGSTGADYRYVPDDEANPVGYASFVSFPGSSTEYAANGGVLADDGTFSATVQVPGAKFTSLDRSGAASEVDCTQVQCGIITIGAHGVPNANNETFTPVRFTDLFGADPAAAGAAPGAEAAPVAEAPAPTAAAAPAPTTTSYVTQPAVVAASDSTAQLIPLITGVIIGVGVLVVLSLAFLVWAVLSGRKRQRALPAAPPVAPEAK
jgi:hypothetical protein